MINNLHHFEILTNSSAKLLNFFMNGFKFKVVYARRTKKFNQYLLNSNSMNFLITSLNNRESEIRDRPLLDTIYATNECENFHYETPLSQIEHDDKRLFELISSKQNTVFNAAFKVADLDRILYNCKRYDVPVLKNKNKLYDASRYDNGYVEYAVIRSCVDGVVHSLFDMSNYKGRFLPGYEFKHHHGPEPSTPQCSDDGLLETHFDHLTYATYKNESNRIINWYKDIFNMKRFKIEREDDGLIVRTGKSGMNIKAIKYWLCAETGVEFNSNNNDFKFVISEPLDDDPTSSTNAKNQISIFLDEHNGPGIQHIGLHTQNIVKSVQNSKANCEHIKYYVTPDSYYNMPEKINEIKDCGLDVNLLRQNHILVDTEFSQDNNNNNNNGDEQKQQENSNTTPSRSSFLLQVFTQPVFDKNTLFLELIQRVGNAQGFGAANIKALWNAVQIEINNRIQQTNRATK